MTLLLRLVRCGSDWLERVCSLVSSMQRPVKSCGLRSPEWILITVASSIFVTVTMIQIQVFLTYCLLCFQFLCLQAVLLLFRQQEWPFENALRSCPTLYFSYGMPPSFPEPLLNSSLLLPSVIFSLLKAFLEYLPPSFSHR